MTTPSLLVLIVSGWGAGKPHGDNLFMNDSYAFLESYLASYPSILLKAPALSLKNNDVYKLIGSGGIASKRNICSLLSSHGIHQYKIADADRFGLLTQQFNGGHPVAYPDEVWQYLNFPSVISLSADLSSTCSQLTMAVDRLLAQPVGTVIYAAISSIWTAGMVKDPVVLFDAIKYVERSIHAMVDKAIDQGFRVLIVSDGGLGEDYRHVLESVDKQLRTTNPLPFLLIHSELEGLQSPDSAYEKSGFVDLTTSGTLFDIMPTILSLMEVYVPDDLPGKSLFQDFIVRTL